MGQYIVCCCRKFYPSVVVNPATLPIIRANETVEAGTQFIIRGRNFNAWPNEIVLTYSEDHIYESTLPQQSLMRLVSKTNSRLVFEQTVTFTYTFEHIWSIFGSPFNLPRTLLEYVTA